MCQFFGEKINWTDLQVNILSEFHHLMTFHNGFPIFERKCNTLGRNIKTNMEKT